MQVLLEWKVHNGKIMRQTSFRGFSKKGKEANLII
jgi:hypothetical protein